MTIEHPSAAFTSTQRILITVAVMLAAIIEVLDMTIVNVSLPQMMGSLSATSDQISWVLTSYIVSAGIFMPLTGFFVIRLGRKRLLLACIAGFLISSVLCGLAVNLFQMVLFRTLQGIFGAALVPLSQFIMQDTFPPEEQGKAMAIWGMGIMAAPVLGPTLGGYITEFLQWRWVFFINIPVCIIAFLLTSRVIAETPIRNDRIDWLGMGLLFVSIGCLQLFLDRGNSEDWFESPVITTLVIIFIITFIGLLIRCVKVAYPIVHLRLFRDRNFALATLLSLAFGVSIFSVLSLQSLMLEHIMSYNALTTGVLMAPRGIASFFGMGLVANLVNRFDARKIAGAGFSIIALGVYLMTYFSLETSQSLIIWTSAIQGFGMGIFFVALSTIAFNTLQHTDIAEASGLFSFARNLGTSIGISIFSTLLVRETQINWNRLSGHINPYNPNFHHFAATLGKTGYEPATLQLLAYQVEKQASMIAFIDSYWAVTLMMLLSIPLLMLMTKTKAKQGVIGH